MRSTFQSDEEQNQVNDEQQHNGCLEHEHPAIGLVVLEQLVKIGQRLELFVDGPVPVAEVEPGRNVFVYSRQVPITEKLRDVGEFIAQARQVNANFAQLTPHIAFAAQRLLPQIAIGPFQRLIQNAVVSLQLRQLEIGQFHDIECLVEILRLLPSTRPRPRYPHTKSPR